MTQDQNAPAHQARRTQPRRKAPPRSVGRVGLGGHRSRRQAAPRRLLSRELHRGRHAAGAAGAAQGHQPLAGRRSGGGGGQAAHGEFPRDRSDQEQPPCLHAAAGKHQREREPPDRREEPDGAVRGLHPPGQQPLHRRLPAQGAHPRHGAPHLSRTSSSS